VYNLFPYISHTFMTQLRIGHQHSNLHVPQYETQA